MLRLCSTFFQLISLEQLSNWHLASVFSHIRVEELPSWSPFCKTHIFKEDTVVPLPTLSLGYHCVPKKESLARSSLARNSVAANILYNKYPALLSPIKFKLSYFSIFSSQLHYFFL